MSEMAKAEATDAPSLKGRHSYPSAAQKKYLRLGIQQPGGKLPLFDTDGQKVSARTIRACLDAGWCEPWFQNPIAPDWLVCKLTRDGLKVLDERQGGGA